MTKDYLIIMLIMGLLGSFLSVYQVSRVYAGEMTAEMKQMQEQLNLEYEEAAPQLTQGLIRSVSGLF